MKIFAKLLLIILGVSLLPLIGAGLITFRTSESALQDQIQVRINNTAQHQLSRIETINDQNMAELNTVQNKAQLRILLQQYEQAPSPRLQASLSQSLSDILAAQDTFHRIHVVNLSGLVVASTDRAAIGQNYGNTEVLSAGLKAPSSNIFFKNAAGNLDQYLAAPLSWGGQALGVVIVEATSAAYLNVTKDYSELGVTGESYLLRRGSTSAFQYLTPLRFNLGAALTASPNSPGYATDYRGHSIIQSTKDIPATDWTLVVKIDTAEVDAPLIKMRNTLIEVLVLATILASFAALYLSRFITNPILRFTQVVKQIQGGDLKQRVRVESNDEIGVLGTAFNEMTSSLLESRTRLIASVLSLTQGFIMTDRNNNIITLNGAARRLLGIDPSLPEASANLTSIFSKAQGLNVGDKVQECFKNQTSSEAREIAFGDKFYTLFFSPVSIDGQAIGVVVLISDETEQKMLQRSRDEFFSIASHELRTPLTAIMGNVSLVKTMYTKVLEDPDLRQMMDDIDYSSKRLIAIVNDFLDMSSLELGKVKYASHPIDIVMLALEVVGEQERAGILHGLTLTVQKPSEPLPLVSGDVDRIKQIFGNLLSNSLKSTDKGGITISFKRTDDLIETFVADTGRGISPENQKLLFQKFQQAADSILTRDTAKGTGLGLYIAKLIAKGMGGNVRFVSSELGKGTTFAFALKVATAQEISADQISGESTSTSAKPVVLLAPEAPTASK